jgi:hypothetical protein
MWRITCLLYSAIARQSRSAPDHGKPRAVRERWLIIHRGDVDAIKTRSTPI